MSYETAPVLEKDWLANQEPWKIKRLIGEIQNSIPVTLPGSVAQYWIEHKGDLKKAMKQLFCDHFYGSHNERAPFEAQVLLKEIYSTDQKPMTAGQMRELFSSVIEALPLDGYEWWQHPFLETAIPTMLMPPTAEAQIANWRYFYRKFFNITLPEEISIPQQRESFTRLIVVAEGITLERILATCNELVHQKRKLEFMLRNIRLDEIQHERVPTKTYAVWVQDGSGSDDPHHFAVQMKRVIGNPMITLVEHLLMALKIHRFSGMMWVERHCMGSFLNGDIKATVCLYFDYDNSRVTIQPERYGYTGGVKEVVAV